MANEMTPSQRADQAYKLKHRGITVEDLKMVSNQKTWPCGHIYRHYDKWYKSSYFDPEFQMGDNENFCSFCGAKRPEEPKSLAHVLFERQGGPGEIDKNAAIRALKWFLGILPLTSVDDVPGSPVYKYCKEIRERIEREIERCK